MSGGSVHCVDRHSHYNKTRMVNEKFKSLFWSYFSPTEPNRAKCNVCYLEFSYAGGSTSNLARHLRTKHPEINLNSQSEYRYQESQAATIIITTQTSSDGECIATIEPFNIIPKEVVKEECLADNHTDYDDGDQRISSIEEVVKEEGLADNHVHLEDSDQRISSLEDQDQSQTENVRHLRKRSLCWSIFKKLDSGKVLCSYCNKVLALPNGNTSNLKRHVRLKHPGVHFSLQAEEIERRKTLRPITRPRFDRVSKSSISYFSVTEESQMPQDMLRLMEETREKLGFVPNVYQALSHRPNEMRAYVTYYETLMEERMGSHLTQSDKEMISIAVSAANKCTYFIIAHSAYFRLCSHNRILADQGVWWREEQGSVVEGRTRECGGGKNKGVWWREEQGSVVEGRTGECGGGKNKGVWWREEQRSVVEGRAREYGGGKNKGVAV
uniref:BED-type domain-containing protein n=1 Tax=Biomphalaria glabrata TaxID=6526 RepID=A0A2C9L1K5_BIOGL